MLEAFFAGVDFFAALVVFLAALVVFLAGEDFFAADVVFFAALVVFFAALVVFFAAPVVFLAGDDFFAAVVFFAAVDFDAVDFDAVVFFAAVLLVAPVDFLPPALPSVFAAVVLRAAGVFLAASDFAAVDFVAPLDRDDELLLEELAAPLTARAAALTGAVATRAAALAGAVAATAASLATEPAVEPVERAGALSFFAPLTTSLNCWPGRNFGTEVFLSFTCAPVAGLRAVRAARSTFSKTPKPEMATRSPLATARVMASVTASTASVAVLLSPTLSVMASMSWALFTRGSLR